MKLAPLLPLVLLVSACGGSGAAVDPAAVERGARLFHSCAACHSLGADHRVGPGLRGVLGRKAGTAPGFAYSEALANAGFVWDEERLVAFLSQENYLPGANMVVTPLSPEDARDVVAYMTGN
ncbi:MAG: c-type cytochrome [Sphingomonadaceae bacterium]